MVLQSVMDYEYSIFGMHFLNRVGIDLEFWIKQYIGIRLHAASDL